MSSQGRGSTAPRAPGTVSTPMNSSGPRPGMVAGNAASPSSASGPIPAGPAAKFIPLQAEGKPAATARPPFPGAMQSPLVPVPGVTSTVGAMPGMQGSMQLVPGMMMPGGMPGVQGAMGLPGPMGMQYPMGMPMVMQGGRPYGGPMGMAGGASFSQMGMQPMQYPQSILISQDRSQMAQAPTRPQFNAQGSGQLSDGKQGASVVQGGTQPSTILSTGQPYTSAGGASGVPQDASKMRIQGSGVITRDMLEAQAAQMKATAGEGETAPAAAAAPANEMPGAALDLQSKIRAKLAAKKKLEEDNAKAAGTFVEAAPAPVAAPAPAPVQVPAPTTAIPVAVAAVAPAAPIEYARTTSAQAPSTTGQSTLPPRTFTSAGVPGASVGPPAAARTMAASITAPRTMSAPAVVVVPTHHVQPVVVAKAPVDTALSTLRAEASALDSDDLNDVTGSTGFTGMGMQRGDDMPARRKAMLLELKLQYENEKNLAKCVLTLSEMRRIRESISAELRKVWPTEMKRHKLISAQPTARQAKEEDDPITRAVKFAKSVLNKITRENFNKLSLDLIKYDVSSQDILEKLIEVVFDKALEDRKYQDVFADLCKLLGEKASEWSDRYLKVIKLTGKDAPAGDGFYYDVSGASKGNEEWNGPLETEVAALETGRRETNFKRLLLNRCQAEFLKSSPQKDLKEQEEDDAQAVQAMRDDGREPTTEEAQAFKERADKRAHQRVVVKRRMLSNVSFIGHLYHTGGQLSVPIMHYCVLRLLGIDTIKDPAKLAELDMSQADYFPDVEGVEALCGLLSLVGRKYENEEGIYAARCREQNIQPLYQVPMFQRLGNWLQQMRKNPNLEARLRFKCQDTIEMRARGWKLTGAQADLERVSKTLTLAEAKLAILEQERSEKAALMGGGGAARQDGYDNRQLGASARSARSGPQDARQSGPGGQGGAGGAPGPRTGGPRPFAGTGLGKAVSRPGVGAAGVGSPAGTPKAGGETEDGWKTVAPVGRGPRPGLAAEEGQDASASTTAASAATAAAEMLVQYSGAELSTRVRGVLREWVTKAAKDEDVFEGMRQLRASPGVGSVYVTECLAVLLTGSEAVLAFTAGGGQALLALTVPGEKLAAVMGSAAPIVSKADVLRGVHDFVTGALISADPPKLGANAAQVLAPLITAQFVTLPELLPAFMVAAAAQQAPNTGGVVVAQIAAAVLNSEQPGSNVAAAVLSCLLESGPERRLPLLRAIAPGASGHMRLKALRRVLIDEIKEPGAAAAVKASAVVAEIDAIIAILKDSMSLLSSGASEAGATLTARVGALPLAVRASLAFARGLAAEWAFIVTFASAADDEVRVGAFMGAVGPALAACVAASVEAGIGLTEETAGAYILSGVQLACASNEDVDLQTVAADLLGAIVPFLGRAAFSAWSSAPALEIASVVPLVVAEPFGRAAATNPAVVDMLQKSKA